MLLFLSNDLHLLVFLLPEVSFFPRDGEDVFHLVALLLHSISALSKGSCDFPHGLGAQGRRQLLVLGSQEPLVRILVVLHLARFMLFSRLVLRVALR